MKTEEKKYSPELRWTLFKIRLLDEDDAAEVLESYAKEHAIEFGKNAFEAGYKYSTGNDSPDWEKWYSEWINQQTK